MSDNHTAALGQVSSDTDDKDTTISPPVPNAQEPSSHPTSLQTDDNNNHNDDQQHDKDDGTECEKDSSVSSSLHAENLNGMFPVVCVWLHVCMWMLCVASKWELCAKDCSLSLVEEKRDQVVREERDTLQTHWWQKGPLLPALFLFLSSHTCQFSLNLSCPPLVPSSRLHLTTPQRVRAKEIGQEWDALPNGPNVDKTSDGWRKGLENVARAHNDRDS